MPPLSNTNSTNKQDYSALNDFVVNCSELKELEGLIGGFNLFSVLGFEYGELRHSNALAWFLNPEESHGLHDSFLQRWLISIIHEAPTSLEITPVDIDCWQLASVEVRREWKNIDLLLILRFHDGPSWIIAIENKVKSKQHSKQLHRYREIVEQNFNQGEKHLFLFLTKDPEDPEDEAYIPTSYAQIHQVLKECRNTNLKSIGNEPIVLIDNYLRLLEEKFMNESDIATLAQRIYQQHKQALDIIFEHRPDNLKLASDSVLQLLKQESAELGIQVLASTKSYIRFIPNEWDLKGNSHGTAWKGTNHSVLIEIAFSPKSVRLCACSGKNPKEWNAEIWELAKAAPFKMPRSNINRLPETWFTFHGYSTQIDTDNMDSDQIAKKILKWIKASLQKTETKEVIDIIATHLPKLDVLS